MDIRKEEERHFHNLLRQDAFGQRWTPDLEPTIKTNALWENMKYYAVERKSRSMVLNWFDQNCHGKSVLDYCCGNGEDALYLAGNGAEHVTGIDISEVSIENCRRRAVIYKVETRSDFLVMDGESLVFQDDSFDVVTEYGSLHHVDLRKAYSELARVVKSSGKVICNEALGHNPAINLYRKLTPALRTKWEVAHILRRKDLELARQYFNKVEVNYFHLMTLAGVPFRNSWGFETLLTLLEFADEMVLRLPILRWLAWQMVFVLSEPKKSRRSH
jgi:ubiquinone/menaquinone biosynthesis C-methylase UbiE